jgi:hypothetical protein
VKDASSEEEFDVGEALGGIMDGAFGLLRHSVKTVSEVVHNMVNITFWIG